MKYIQKQLEPEFFIEAKKDVDNSCGDPWLKSESINKIRAKLREYIANEQNNCCAYCEKHINADSSEDCDIDHYRKRDIFNSLDYILDYNNLLVSCKNHDHCSNYKDKHMDIIDKKGKDKYNYIINPADENDKPEKYFIYDIYSQTIKPRPSLPKSEKEKAELTIKVFQLNCRSLINARRKVIEAVYNIRKSGRNFKLEELVSMFGFYSFLKKLI